MAPAYKRPERAVPVIRFREESTQVNCGTSERKRARYNEPWLSAYLIPCFLLLAQT